MEGGRNKRLRAKHETVEKEMANEVKKRTNSGRASCKRRTVSEKSIRKDKTITRKSSEMTPTFFTVTKLLKN